MNLVEYITLEEAIAKHDEIILASGGLLGLRDEGLLISALTMIQNDFYYSEYHEKLTHLIFSINKNHCFIDGNKRASISLGALFLLKNGWPSEFIADFIIAMEEVVVELANDEINKRDLRYLIKCSLHKLTDKKYYVCEIVQRIINTYKILEKDLSNRIQLDNDQYNPLKKLMSLDQLQSYEDEMIILERKKRSAQMQLKIWELILKFLQN